MEIRDDNCANLCQLTTITKKLTYTKNTMNLPSPSAINPTSRESVGDIFLSYGFIPQICATEFTHHTKLRMIM